MNRVSSLTQAAILLNALPTAQAAKVISRLEAADIKMVIDAVSRLDYQSSQALVDATKRFANDSATFERISRNDAGIEQTRREIDEILRMEPSELDSAASENPFGFLEETIPVIRCHLLQDEHPRNIAVVLSTLPPKVASETMKSFDDPQFRTSILKRMCELEEVNHVEVNQLRFALQQRLKKMLNAHDSKGIGLTVAVDMLSYSDEPTRESLLAHIEQIDPDLAMKLSRSVVGFDRLNQLSKAQLKIILKHVDTSSWAPALKYASSKIRQNVYDAMAKPAVKILQQEIDELGRVDADLEQLSRQNIMHTVMDLARSGKIDLRKSPRTPNPVS